MFSDPNSDSTAASFSWIFPSSKIACLSRSMYGISFSCVVRLNDSRWLTDALLTKELQCVGLALTLPRGRNRVESEEMHLPIWQLFNIQEKLDVDLELNQWR